MKLTTSILQKVLQYFKKLAKFYIWNVKQNDDGVCQRKEPALGTWCCK